MAHAHLLAPDLEKAPETKISKKSCCSEEKDDLNDSKPVFQESQEQTVDQIIENEARRCWDDFVDDGKIGSLAQDETKKEEFWFDVKLKSNKVQPRLKMHSFKLNAGLFHAIIKHGSSFHFLKNPFWLETLNKSCEEFKKFPTSTLKDYIQEEIRKNFEDILKLSKTLGEHLKELIENPNAPVLMVSNEKAILVFSKILEAKKPRFYMFVLANGAGTLPKFTMITAMKLRKNNFKKRILVNGKIPKLWFDCYTGRIHYCSPEIFSENGLFICLGRAKEKNCGFEEFL